MLLVPPPKFRKDRRRVKQQLAAPTPPLPGAPLVLQSASYNPGEDFLYLTFDRDVDISEFDGSQLTVNDGVNNNQAYAGTGGVSGSGAFVYIQLAVTGSYAGDDVNMSATGLTGLKAADDGGSWAGASDLELPWSS